MEPKVYESHKNNSHGEVARIAQQRVDLQTISEPTLVSSSRLPSDAQENRQINYPRQSENVVREKSRADNKYVQEIYEDRPRQWQGHEKGEIRDETSNLAFKSQQF